MTQYAIMTTDLSSYYHSPGHSHLVRDYYDSIQDYVTKEGSNIHRAVLVSMKRKRTGTTVELNTGKPIRWVPLLEWRYEKSLRWLNFSVRVEGRFREVPDKIIKDHYADHLVKAAPEKVEQ